MALLVCSSWSRYWQTYRSQTIVTSDAPSLLGFLQAHGPHIFPDACNNSSASVFVGVEEVGQRRAELEALWAFVACEVDADADLLVTLALKLQNVEIGFGIGTSLLSWERGVCRSGLFPFDVGEAIWLQRGGAVKVDGDVAEEVAELGLLVGQRHLGELLDLFHGAFRVFIHGVFVLVVDILLGVRKQAALDLDAIPGLRVLSKVKGAVGAESLASLLNDLPRLSLGGVADPDPQSALSLPSSGDLLVDVQSLLHHGGIQPPFELAQLVVSVNAVANADIFEVFGEVAVGGLAGLALCCFGAALVFLLLLGLLGGAEDGWLGGSCLGWTAVDGSWTTSGSVSRGSGMGIAALAHVRRLHGLGRVGERSRRPHKGQHRRAKNSTRGARTPWRAGARAAAAAAAATERTVVLQWNDW